MWIVGLECKSPALGHTQPTLSCCRLSVPVNCMARTVLCISFSFSKQFVTVCHTEVAEEKEMNNLLLLHDCLVSTIFDQFSFACLSK